MPGIAYLPAALLAAALIIVIPGPATVYVAGRVRFGAASGALATLGVITGDLALMSLSGLVFVTLATQWPVLMQVIQVVGALYLAYLALELLNSPPMQVAPGTAPAPHGSFTKALVASLANPRPILFFAAFFPMFIERSGMSALQSFLTLAIMFELLNVVYIAIVIARLHRFAALRKLSAWGLLLCSGLILLAQP